MRLIFDIESDGLYDEATKIHSLVIKDIDGGCVYSCHDNHPFKENSVELGLTMLADADEIQGHNCLDFDLPVIRKLYPGFRLKEGCIVRDTLLISRLIWTDLATSDHSLMKRNPNFPARLIGSHSLKAWGFRLGTLKSDFGDTTDWKQWSPQMQKYCEQDVEVSDALRKHIDQQNYSQEAIQLEHDFAEVIYKMCRHGFAFDLPAATKLYSELIQKREELKQELQRSFPPTIETMKTPAYWLGKSLFGGSTQYPTKTAAVKAGATDIEPGPPKTRSIPFNPGSRQQVAQRLIELGWKPSKKTDSGAVCVDESVLETIDLPAAKPLQDYFLLQKRIGQLAEGNESWIKAEKAGRVYHSVITNGAVTGRCAHRHFNIAQVPRVGFRKNPATGIEELVWGQECGWGTDCRALFTASPGKVLVGADASGVELRCLAHYLAAFDGGRYAEIVCDGDVHTENQKAFGLPPGKEGRNCSKTGIYCKVYGGGPEKMGEALILLAPEHEAAAQSMSIPEWAKKSMAKKGPITKQRAANWKRGKYASDRIEKGIVGLDALLAGIERASQRGWLKGLDGRRLHVRSSHAALNTLLQSAGALLMKKAVVLWYHDLRALGLEWGVDFALNAMIHDEIQAECKPEYADLVGGVFVRSLQAAGLLWNFRCPLNGEYKVGNNWAETH